ncbi:hypothetical protein O6H91_19G080800 [Diphasiastrum complanatum]|uniref:Uncharacterized protein n=1 Tax=Diphasiastrum complanatum TaxID=34168 RepID=A0ACC2AX89_DIPCM|nr:hypothetical protein O6H91_19G080800 [Diphasiastrum complanatum]
MAETHATESYVSDKDLPDVYISHSCAPSNRTVARYIYGIIFFLTNLIAWMVRDYSHKALSELHYLKGCEGGHNCLGSEGVLRISLGCFMFFLIMFITTVGTSKIEDPRDSWHSGWWPVKSLLWIALMVVPFLLPTTFIHMYGEIARYGAGIFLLVQLLSVINFIYWWHEDWASEEKKSQCHVPMMLVSIGSFGVSLFAIVVMYIWFAPHVSCSLNIFFITWTLVLIYIMTAISLHSKVSAGLMASGIMAVYLVFLCWSAIMSEPLSETCNTRPRQTGKGDWLTIVLPKDNFNIGDEVPYGYGFFHFVFAIGSMYFAMLFVGWNLHQTMNKWSLDVGWASTWVKVANEWVAAAIYIWTMVGRFILKNRDFS